jgi:hypothetical protein
MYVIEHRFSYGWEAVGVVENEDGTREIELFATQREARDEITSMIASANIAGMDYKRADWRARKVTEDDPVEQTFAVRIQCGGISFETLVRARSAGDAVHLIRSKGSTHEHAPTDAQRSAYIRHRDKCPAWKMEG